MKKFIYSLLVFGVLVSVIYSFISFYVKPQDDSGNDYMAAMIDKHKRIDQLNCPKIIFAGGSNLAFGLNSEAIEHEFSVPVVNLGLSGGLGLTFILNELKNTIKNGDVVFLSIEYLLDADGDYKLKKLTGNIYEEAEKYYATDIKAEILSDIDNTRRNMKSEKKNSDAHLKLGVPVYSRNAFNKYGDNIAHLEKSPPRELEDRIILKYTDWSGVDEINEFYNFAKSRNVTVFFMYPNFPVSEFTKNQKEIDKLALDFSGRLNVEILNKPSDFVFPDSLFFDTIYHLNKKGREMRTEKLIELIKRNATAQQRLSVIKISI